MQLSILPYIFDLEISGKCNTTCSFCPRHEMLRGEEFMSEETFEHVIAKLSHYAPLLQSREVYLPTERARVRLGSGTDSPLRVILCGMGEALMHRNCAAWIRRLRTEIGIRVSLVTNGLLLKERMVEQLLESDITVVLVSVPGIDPESYSRYMQIDWHRVMKNLEAAHNRMPGRILINATVPDDAPFTAEQVQAFWEARGIPIAGINQCHNRGGFLTDTNLTSIGRTPKTRFCGIIARHNFISWSGHILSCCHDLHGSNVIGHVAQDDFMTIAQRKDPIIREGPPFAICTGCNDGERGHAGQIIATT